MGGNKIPADLKKAIINNQLVIFVGAGLSYNLINIHGQQIYGWSNLVEQILKNLSGKTYEVDFLIPLVSKYDPIKVLDLIESDKNLPKKEIYKFIKDFFDLKEDENSFELHKKLFELSKKIITTNYDTAFEKAIPELRKNKAYKGKNYELTTHKDPNSTLLFKLHGCFEDVDSMVVFPTNYNNLYNDNDKGAEHSLSVFKNIVYNKSILFIGTGMGDFQINNIFKEIKKIQGEYNQKHFIISNKPLDSSLSFLIPIYVNKHKEIEAIIDVLISLKKEFGGKEPDEIVALRKQLVEANMVIEQLRLENSSNKATLQEKDAFKYFSKGVEFSISNESEKAIIEYEKALELKPNLHEAFFNWGNSLRNLARKEVGKEAEKLYYGAFEKYQKAVGIEPALHEAFNNWGNSLTGLARTREGEEADKLYLEAIGKFKKAIDIKPDKHEAFFNWGNSLRNLARTKAEEEAEELFLEAFEKYQKAIDIKPDKHSAFNNWGTSLGELARTKKGKEADKLYLEAFEKYQKAVDFGASYYNLSCTHALRGDKRKAIEYLNTCLSKDEIGVDFVEKDKDWENYLADEEFTRLLEKYKK